ncbi:MAG TPA: prepilin-type N-terminal cleavage/methylation domain-containing protein [Planctomycetota bacterium]|nr:prepilin-type N-terminal cleavage/methylation domain-containing protein [Planctomycetota bacterium]
MMERSHSGFTLIELLVVLAIMAIMAVVAMPAAGASYDQRLDLVEMQITDAIGRAQALARSTQLPFGVVFDASGERFAVVDSTGAAVTDPLTRSSYIVGFDRPDQPKGIDVFSAAFGANGAAAIFDGQGLPVSGGTVVVRCHGSTRTLTLDQATGQLASS